MPAVLESDYYLKAGVAFTALNLVNMLLWAAGLYLPTGAWVAVLLLCLWPAVRQLRLNGLLVVNLMVVLVVITLLHPVTGWDARSIWMFHAKRIFLEGSLYAPLDNYAPWTHNDYPVIVPAIAASLAKSMGYWNEIVPRASVAIALAPALFFGAYLMRSFAACCAWISLVLWICWGELLSGYMDCLIAVNFALAVLAVAEIYRRGANRMANLPGGPAVVLAASMLHLLFLKNEGAVMCGLLLVVMLPAMTRRPALALPVLLPWLVYALLWKLPVMRAGITTDLVKDGGLLERGMQRLKTPEDILLILHYFRAYSAEFFGILGLVLVVLGLWRRKLWYLAPSLLAVGGYVAVLFVVFVTTYQPLRWHLNTAADRVLIAFNLGAASLMLYMVYDGLRRLAPAWRPREDSGA